jgi:hypothetical protein
MSPQAQISWVYGTVFGMIIGLSACAQVRMAGFDHTTGSVRYCGNSRAYHDEIVAAAREDCAPGRALLTLRCHTEPTDAHASTVALGNGTSSNLVSQERGECCDFKCAARN